MSFLERLFRDRSREEELPSIPESPVTLVHTVQVADDLSAQTDLHVHCLGRGYDLVVEAELAPGEVEQQEVACGFDIRCGFAMAVKVREERGLNGTVVLTITRGQEDCELPVALCTVTLPPDARRVDLLATITPDGAVPQGFYEAMGFPFVDVLVRELMGAGESGGAG